MFVDEVACSNPDLCEDICDNRSGCTNIAYPLLVVRILPTGKITIYTSNSNLRLSIYIHTGM